TLLSLMWSAGWPVIVLALILVLLALWRGAPRFGPLEAPPSTARRSLAEQIRGTGQFTLRVGGGRALQAAALPALADLAVARLAPLGGRGRGAHGGLPHPGPPRAGHGWGASPGRPGGGAGGGAGPAPPCQSARSLRPSARPGIRASRAAQTEQGYHSCRLNP